MRTTRVYLDLNVAHAPWGCDERRFVYEVTDDGHDTRAELISGDVEDANEIALEEAEREAIEQARAKWAAQEAAA